MTWLFAQLWFLLLLAFLVGSLVTWLVLRLALPSEDDLEAEYGVETEGVL
jgi:hypothetical protein